MKTLKEDESLFLDFATQFLGYGSLDAPIWLLGPEAGGGASIAELHRRINVWAERGRKETEDLQEYHKALELPPESNWAEKEQATWAALIRIILATGGKDPGEGDVLRFQVEALGKDQGDFCVLDVSQISCPRKTGWVLGPSEISWLRTKEAYKAKILESRCERFRALLNSCDPKLVVLYGTSEEDKDLWRKIAGADKNWNGLSLPSKHQVSWSRGEPRISWAHDGRTLYIAMPHPGGIRPSGEGSRKQFFAGLGRAIADKLGTSGPKVLAAIKRW
jgi:hypothetical protein